MEINLLLRLIVAHLLTDFILQPNSWVEDRKQKRARSPKLYLHVILTTVVAYLFSGMYTNWIIPLVIFSTHLLIDLGKALINKDNFRYFLADQIAHLLVIFVLCLSLGHGWAGLIPVLEKAMQNQNVWVFLAGYVFVSWPLGILIGKATQKWRDQIARETEPQVQTPSDEQELGLANAGKYIGICERVLILTFVLMQQYTAIGFLMTAKSILRFSEKEGNTQLKTEYVLVGTLVSFASSAMVGVLLNFLLR